MDAPVPVPELEDEIKKENKTWKEKLKYVANNITIEPMLICYIIPGTLARLSTQDLNLDKACRVNKGYNTSVCDSLLHQKGSSYKDEEQSVQELVASMEIWKHIILLAIPSILILFVGAWSDRTRKRKICILMPKVGELVMCLSNMLNVYYFYELPLEVTMFMEAIFPAITGGWVVGYMGIFSYISDISPPETRTFRMGIISLCMTAGGPIGTALSGVLLKQIGYYGVFSICSLMYVFGLLYGMFYIRDPEVKHLKPLQVKTDTNGVMEFLKDFFDVGHLKETFNVIKKKKPNNRRWKFFLLFVCVVLCYGPAFGEYVIKYLFTRYRFNWDVLKFSFYNTFYIIIHGFGALISIALFSRRLKWHDSVLAIISSISKIAGGTATGLSRTSQEMYIAVLIETFNASTFTALRSISSKLVASDELGKLTSVFNLIENVSYMTFGPLYSWIYKESLTFDSGLVFYVGSVLTVPIIIIHIWFLIQHKRECNMKKIEESNTKTLSLNSIKFIDEDVVSNRSNKLKIEHYFVFNFICVPFLLLVIGFPCDVLILNDLLAAGCIQRLPAVAIMFVV